MGRADQSSGPFWWHTPTHTHACTTSPHKNILTPATHTRGKCHRVRQGMGAPHLCACPSILPPSNHLTTQTPTTDTTTHAYPRHAQAQHHVRQGGALVAPQPGVLGCRCRCRCLTTPVAPGTIIATRWVHTLLCAVCNWWSTPPSPSGVQRAAAAVGHLHLPRLLPAAVLRCLGAAGWACVGAVLTACCHWL